MSKIEKQSAALAVFSNATLTPARRDKIIAAAKEQLVTLVSHRQQAPLRAIALGMLLTQLKAGCAHGEWMPLYEQILAGLKFVTPGYARVLTSYYMRLALVFLAAKDAAKPEYIALIGDNPVLSLEPADVRGRAFLKKLTDFVDDCSLEELLEREKIKKRKKRAGGDDEADGNEAETAQTAQDLFNEIEERLQLACKTASDKSVWMKLSRQQHDELLNAARQTFEGIQKLHTKTHGRAKE